MSKWHAFQYRDFWDKPRILYVCDGERCFLLSSPFDEALDQYAENYTVYLMPRLGPEALSGSWEHLEKHALRLLGTIALPLSALDDTRRTQIDLCILDPLLADLKRQ
jgi:hypothetical protein